MKLQNILDYLQTIAPAAMKYEWDNVGLLCGSREQEVHKILVALDPFMNVCEEAKTVGADMILTHHPLIFRAPKSITTDDPIGRCILFLASNGIAAVNAHTNYDCAPGGVNDVLAETLELRNVEVIDPLGTDEQGRPYGLLRKGDIKEMSLEIFMAHVKEKLGISVLRYADSGKSVKKVAVGGGSCGDEYEAALAAGCDTLVTADVKYNQFREAFDMGLNIIDAGHFHTENPSMAPLAAKLQAQFPEISVEISKNHTDCMKFY